MNRIKEILKYEFNLIISPRTIDRLLKAEKEILKYYISKEDVMKIIDKKRFGYTHEMVVRELLDFIYKLGGSNG